MAPSQTLTPTLSRARPPRYLRLCSGTRCLGSGAAARPRSSALTALEEQGFSARLVVRRAKLELASLAVRGSLEAGRSSFFSFIRRQRVVRTRFPGILVRSTCRNNVWYRELKNRPGSCIRIHIKQPLNCEATALARAHTKPPLKITVVCLRRQPKMAPSDEL